MSEEVAEAPGWTTLDEELALLQVAEEHLSSAREEVDTIRHRILQTLERDGGHTYHGDVGTASLIRTRKVTIDEALKGSIVQRAAEDMSDKYTVLVPTHFELTPLFVAHARDGVFNMAGVRVTETASVRVTFHAKKG